MQTSHLLVQTSQKTGLRCSQDVEDPTSSSDTLLKRTANVFTKVAVRSSAVKYQLILATIKCWYSQSLHVLVRCCARINQGEPHTFSFVIVHTILGGSPVILWISLGGKPKWLPLKFGYHDVMHTSPIFVNCIFSWFVLILIFVNWGLPSIKICIKKPLVKTDFSKFVQLTKFTKISRFKAGPLDLNFWSFLTFCTMVKQNRGASSVKVS